MVIVLLVWAVLKVTDNLLQVEAKRHGADTSTEDYSLIPPLMTVFTVKKPPQVGSDKYFKLKRGFDIKLNGVADQSKIVEGKVSRFAVRPPDFRGISPIPKVMVEVGDDVLAGQPIFFDKKNPEIKYVTPVSGEIVEVRRGKKRAITEVIILADKEQKYHVHKVPSLDSERSEMVDFLVESGVWPLINQRPFDIVPERDIIPANIFISTFDSSPILAASINAQNIFFACCSAFILFCF